MVWGFTYRGGGEKKQKTEKPAGISEMLSKGLRHGCILYSAAYLIVSFSVLLPYLSLCKKTNKYVFSLCSSIIEDLFSFHGRDCSDAAPRSITHAHKLSTIESSVESLRC